MPITDLPDGAIKDTRGDRKALRGAVVLSNVAQGAMLQSAQILRAGAPGFLAAALRPKMRAISMQVTPVSSVGGLVEPGDHVDLILTQSIHSGGAPPSVVARGVVAGVRVIAVDQTFIPPDILNAESVTEGTTHSNKPAIPVVPPTTVTLEVTPEQAVAINVAAEMGHLSLAIQSSHGHDAGLMPEVKDQQVGNVPAPEEKSVGNVTAVSGSGTTVHVYNGVSGSMNVQF